MNKIRKSIILCLIISLFTAVCMPIFAGAENIGEVSVSSAQAKAGETVQLNIEIKHNPGLNYLKFKIDYDDSAMTLENVENKSLLSGMSYTPSRNLTVKPYLLSWTAAGNANENGVIAVATFKINDDASNADYNVTVTELSAVNETQNKLALASADGKITVTGGSVVTPPEPPITDPFVNKDALLEAFKNNTEKLVDRNGVINVNADKKLSGDASGAYSLIFADADNDGINELIVFSVDNTNEPYNNRPVASLKLTVYDIDENGKIYSADCMTDCDSAHLYEYSGAETFFAAVDNGKIVLLTHFNFDSDDWKYEVLSFDGKEIKSETVYNFTTNSVDAEDKLIVTVADVVMQYTIGSEETINKIAEIKAQLGNYVKDFKLFPINADGSSFSNDVLITNADLSMIPEYNSGTGILTFTISDRTDSYEQYKYLFKTEPEPNPQPGSDPDPDPKPPVTEYSLGDVNNDGKITAADARIVLRVSAKLETLNSDAEQYADIDSNGKITAADARIVLRISAQLDSIDNYKSNPTPPNTPDTDKKISLSGIKSKSELENIIGELDRVEDEDGDYYFVNKSESVMLYINDNDIIQEFYLRAKDNYSVFGVYVGQPINEAVEAFAANGFIVTSADTMIDAYDMNGNAVLCGSENGLIIMVAVAFEDC